jgi:hypothetical protein
MGGLGRHGMDESRAYEHVAWRFALLRERLYRAVAPACIWEHGLEDAR